METLIPEDYDLPDDAVWFITGCSSGIGLALAKYIATEQPKQRVVATARNIKSLSDSVSDLPAALNVLKLDMDVTSIQSIRGAFNAAHACFGRLDVVVNNAGYNLIGDTEASPGDNAAARALFDTNFWGAVDVTKYALKVFRTMNPATGQQGGVIVNVTSVGELMDMAGSAFYHASKFALEGFAESVAKEVSPEWNIHFVNVQPARVRTNHLTSSLKRMENRYMAYVGNPNCATNRTLHSLDDVDAHGRFLEPEEVAKGIYMVVGSGKKIPIRVPLGGVAWDMIHNEVKRMGRDLEEWWVISHAIGDLTGASESEKE
ncbi:short-chain dehydrogenase/reductase-like protein SDR [Hypoxylon sp. EC38]|nr:short-chain dehydrogenase/reductase-like protein SDR [Hypoxylon sp. EC38]